MMALGRWTLVVRIVAVTAMLAFAAVATRAYLDASRLAGDVVLAEGAIEGLTFVGHAAVPIGESTPYSNALEDNWMAIDLYLHSETHDAYPDVTRHIDRSWTAYLVADGVWRLSEDGETQPRVSDVYAAEALVESIPALSAVVIGAGDDARFDNAGMKAVDALFAAAAEERSVAESMVRNLAAQR